MSAAFSGTVLIGYAASTRASSTSDTGRDASGSGNGGVL